MKLSITLGDADIKAALIAHAKTKLNIDLADETVTVNLTTGRKGNGASAEIIIGSDTEAAAAPVVETAPVAVTADEELPAPIPETPGHETETKTSLFE